MCSRGTAKPAAGLGPETTALRPLGLPFRAKGGALVLTVRRRQPELMPKRRRARPCCPSPHPRIFLLPKKPFSMGALWPRAHANNY